MKETDYADKILIIEDDFNMASIITTFLKNNAYNVIAANNGKKGLELYENENPDCILMDIKMPEMQGLTVLKKIRNKDSETPVIIMSGTGSIDDVVEALRLGAFDFLTKPLLNLDIVLHTVKNALEKKALVQQNKKYQEHLEDIIKEKTIELKQANEMLITINTKLREIADSERKLSSFTQMNEFGSHVMQEFSKHLVATGGSIYIVETDGLKLIYTLDPGHAKLFLPFPLRKNSLFERVYNSGKPLLIKNLRDEKNLNPSGWNKYDNDSVLCFPLPDENGTIVGLISLHSKINPPFTDIDLDLGSILASYSSEVIKAVKAFETVKEKEYHYQRLIETTTEGYWLINEKLCILDVNNALSEMIDYSINNILGRHPYDFVIPEEQEYVYSQLLLTFEKKHNSFETSLLNKNGDKVHVHINASLLKEKEINGKMHIVAYAFITNISERKKNQEEKDKLQAQLLQAQKMESIGTLAGGIAHDFNNLLTVINGRAQLLLMDMKPDSPLKSEIDEILIAGEQALSLTTRLLSFSRKQLVNPAVFDLNVLIESLRKLLQRLIGEEIIIKVDLSNKKLIVKADPGQIEQILINLIINARDAIMEKNKEEKNITIETGLSFLNQSNSNFSEIIPDGYYVFMKIKDSGIGILKENKDKIFDPFFTTKALGKGTGLGLPTVYHLVKQLDGYINCISEYQTGTEFEIYIPYIDEKTTNESKKNTTVLDLKGDEKILFVEDDEAIQKFAIKALETQGYTVVTASNGKEAISKMSSLTIPFDLIITDLIMPEMNGKELAEHILFITPNAKLLYTSGYSDEFMIARGIISSNDNILKKPYTAIDLLQKIKGIIHKT